MDLRDLLYIKAICDAGSMRQAAATLGVSQPTLSNCVSRLEDRLGEKLFDRTKGKARAMPLGTFVAGRAEIILENAATLAREIEAVTKGEAGCVRVGFGPAVSRNMLLAIVKRVRRDHPTVAVEAKLSSVRQLVNGLAERQFDAVICDAAADGPRAALVSEILLEDDFVVAARPDHPVMTRSDMPLAEMFTYSVALTSVPSTYKQVLRMQFGVDVEMPTQRVLCPDFQVLVELAKTGEYFTAGPEFAFEDDVRDGSLVTRKFAFPIRHRVVLMTNTHAFPSRSTERALDTVRDWFRAYRESRGAGEKVAVSA